MLPLPPNWSTHSWLCSIVPLKVVNYQVSRASTYHSLLLKWSPSYGCLWPTNISTNLRLRYLFEMVFSEVSPACLQSAAGTDKAVLFFHRSCFMILKDRNSTKCAHFGGIQGYMSAFRSICSVGLWPHVYSGLVGSQHMKQVGWEAMILYWKKRVTI